MSNRKFAGKLIRVISAAMAALFIFSPTSFVTEIKALPISSYAFSTVKTEEEFRVAVGVRYGSSAYPLHAITSPYGFVFGEAEITRTEHNFTPLYTIEETDIAAVGQDMNLIGCVQPADIRFPDNHRVYVMVQQNSLGVPGRNIDDFHVFFDV